MTLIRELIDIPTEVRRDDFVLNLADGVANADVTLLQYVVTPQLARAFDDALGFVEVAVQGGKSRAAYLHGSFGSGKSHFMAVLHLLLNGHPAARGLPRLQEPLGKHPGLNGKKFLLVPFHMIGARTLEEAIFSGYVKHVTKLHPNATPPGVYRTEALFENASALRKGLGDATFFATLNATKADEDLPEELGTWGDIEGGWTAARFDAAVAAAPNNLERRMLLQALVATHFPAFTGYAAGDHEAMVGIDDGLAALSHHARSLGYDALVLFLDEVVLWLAGLAADKANINQEAQKLAKLVESQNVDRPAPIVAFLARQRKLSELVGEQMDGVERTRLDASFAWNDGRFAEIVLEDRNLPLIARERLLKPRDAAAKAALDGAFDRFARGPQQVIDQLMTSADGLDAFRAVYPFTPVLVQALVALSAALQRERTALRVMLMLLVAERDRLELGQVIPVGDLWDVINRGAEPFSAEMKDRFDAAKRLWREKLLPLIRQTHGADPDNPGDAAEAALRGARNDARLAKTLLLGALVPQVEALRGLDAHKLAALNHGTIRSPIPGQEASTVLNKVRSWAGQIGEIRLTADKANPTIHVELSNVDVDGLIEKVAHLDTPGNAKTRIGQLVFAAFGMVYGKELTYQRTIVWRGSSRSAELALTNVREQDDSTLTVKGDRWRVLVDYPFDQDEHGPAEDVERVNAYLASHTESSRVLLWLPRFLGTPLRKDLGTLVCIEHLLSGDVFDKTAGHLSPEQRTDARAQLDHRRSALEIRVTSALAAAYGLQQPDKGMLDDAHGEHDRFFVSLTKGFVPQKPGTGDLGQGLDALLDQALRHQYPAHPDIDLRDRDGTRREVKGAMAKRVWFWCKKAAADANRREIVEKKERPEVKEIVEKLRLGTLDDGPLVLGTYWRDELERRRLGAGKAAPTVAELRGWIDPPEARSGLPNLLSDLIVLVYAALTNRRFTIYGGPVDEPEPGELREEHALETLDLPDDATWQTARTRAEALFGVSSNRLCNGTNVQQLSDAVREKLIPLRKSAAEGVRLLDGRADDIQRTPTPWPRREAAAQIGALPDPSAYPAPKAFIGALAAIPPLTDERVVVREMGCLEASRGALSRGAEWSIFGKLPGLQGPRADDAVHVLDDLRAGLGATEAAMGLGGLIDRLYPVALNILTPVIPPPDGWEVVKQGGGRGPSVDWASLQAAIEAAEEAATSEHRVTVTWTVEQKKPRP